MAGPILPQIQPVGGQILPVQPLDYSPLFQGGGVLGGLSLGLQQGQQMAFNRKKMDAFDTAAAQQAEDNRVKSVVTGAIEVQGLPPDQQLSILQKRRQRLMEGGIPTETTDEAIELLQTDYPAFSQGVEQAVNFGYKIGMLKPAQGAGYTESKIPGYAFNKATGRLEVADQSLVDAEAAEKARIENQERLKADLEALTTTFERSKALRTEYEKKATEFKKVRSAFDRVQASIESPDAAGDIALIFNYMKMLDPGSTVLEGEFATASNAGGVDTTVYNMYNKLMSGERLTENQRKMFANRSKKLFKKSEAQNNRDVTDTLNLGKRYGLVKDDIFGPGTNPTEKTPAAPPDNAIEPAPNIPDGQTANNGALISKGGYWVPNQSGNPASPEAPANALGQAAGMADGMTGTTPDGKKVVVENGYWVPVKEKTPSQRRQQRRKRN